MIELTESTNTGVFAPVASGKTFLMDEWLKVSNRYVRFDYTGETTNKQNVEHIYSPRELLNRIEKNPWYYRIAYHPGKNVMEHYRWCQKAVWMFDQPRLLAIDEYHRICPQGPRLDEDVESSLRLARHNQLALLGMSQRPQDVNKLFVDSCRMCVIFRSQEENFLNACAGHWGEDVASAVENCRPLIYRDTTKTVLQKQQCVVVTRDGQPARVYDFQTDKFIPVQKFLEDKENGISEPSPTDLDSQGSSDGSILNGEGNSDSGGSENSTIGH